jgi:bis(5'-nucleosyl)-tetraphosphatase (symmetrical)
MLKAIEKWPLYIEEEDFIALHGGIVPGKSLNEMSAKEITTIRMWHESHEDHEHGRPWYEYYEGEKPVIFGHWAKKEGIDEHNVIGIDTGCVYGKSLTALIWPEKKRVTVPAKKVYYPLK